MAEGTLWYRASVVLWSAVLVFVLRIDGVLIGMGGYHKLDYHALFAQSRLRPPCIFPLLWLVRSMSRFAMSRGSPASMVLERVVGIVRTPCSTWPTSTHRSVGSCCERRLNSHETVVIPVPTRCMLRSSVVNTPASETFPWST